MKNRNLLIVFHSFGKNIGGVGKSLQTFINDYKGEIDLLILGEKSTYVFPENVRILYAEPKKMCLIAKLLLSSRFFSRVLSKFLQLDFEDYIAILKSTKLNKNSTNYDQVIAFSNTLLTYRYINRYFSKKHVSSVVHTLYNDDKTYRRRTFNFLQTYFRGNKKLLFDSKNAGELFDGYFKYTSEKIIINPLIGKKFYDSAGRKVLNYVNKKDHLKLSCVARLDIYDKGLDILLAIAKKLIRLDYEFSLHIYGEGNDRKKLEEIIEDYDLIGKVLLHGNTTDVYSHIIDSDIYFQLSRNEAYCLSIDEAISLGLKTYSSNIKTFIDRFDENKVNKFVDINSDVSELVDSLVELIEFDENIEENKNITIIRSINDISRTRIKEFLNESK